MALEALRVLFVEDDPDTRLLLGRALKRRVGKLWVAGNGADGLALARAQRPDVIITDLEMPVMDGLTMIRELRNGGFARTRIVVVTAHNDRAHRSELADRHLIKPVNLQELFELLDGGWEAG